MHLRPEKNNKEKCKELTNQGKRPCEIQKILNVSRNCVYHHTKRKTILLDQENIENEIEGFDEYKIISEIKIIKDYIKRGLATKKDFDKMQKLNEALSKTKRYKEKLYLLGVKNDNI
jgi:hypothetical protein